MSDVEQRLRAAGQAWRDEQPGPSRAAAPRRSRWLPAAAAVAVVALALSATALAGRTTPDDDDGDAAPPPVAGAVGAWQAMSASPLSPRLRPTLTGWGDRVVVVGGDPYSRPCPPNASCVRDLREAPRDGAVYDVSSDTWERLPDAPLPLDVSSSTVLQDVLYLWVQGRVVALDLAARTWSTLPDPPVVSDYLRLVAAGDRLVAAYGEVGRADALDLAYDPESQQWEPLPAAPFAPSFDRVMTWTGDSLVLVAAAPAGQEGPPFQRAAVLQDGSWRALPPQDTVIFGATDWAWTGDRVVNASTATADGGATNGFGRAYPSGGYLDPTSGRWSELPAAPAGHERAGGLPYAAGGRWVANGEGLVLDTRRDRWVTLPPYDDAPDQEAGAAWAAGRLVVWGGATAVQPAPEPDEARVLGTGAVWTPPQD